MHLWNDDIFFSTYAGTIPALSSAQTLFLKPLPGMPLLLSHTPAKKVGIGPRRSIGNWVAYNEASLKKVPSPHTESCWIRAVIA